MVKSIHIESLNRRTIYSKKYHVQNNLAKITNCPLCVFIVSPHVLLFQFKFAIILGVFYTIIKFEKRKILVYNVHCYTFWGLKAHICEYTKSLFILVRLKSEHLQVFCDYNKTLHVSMKKVPYHSCTSKTLHTYSSEIKKPGSVRNNINLPPVYNSNNCNEK